MTIRALTSTIDDLCFLLHSPLFLYAIAPRLRRATTSLKSDAQNLVTAGSLVNGTKKAEEIYRYGLKMMVVWDGNSWATRLLYGETPLMEGRQYKTTEKAGSGKSFHWFCDEVRFLSCEFRAREHAAMVALGSAVDTELTEVEVGQTRAKSEGKRQRRIVKLKIRYKVVHHRPVLTNRAK